MTVFKDKIIRIIFGFLLFSAGVGWLYGQQIPAKSSCREVKTTVLFPIGQSRIDPDFRRNGLNLLRFTGQLQQILADTNYIVTSLTITGTASPDGKEDVNILLAGRRAEAMAAYIRSRVPLPDSIIHIQNKGENWEGLTALVETTKEVPDRQQVLYILKNEPDRDRRKNKLMFYNDSKPWYYMMEHFFSDLRAVGGTGGVDTGVSSEITFSYAPNPAKTEPEDHPEEIQPIVPAPTVIPAVPEKKKILHPVLALKTDLPLWAGLTPNFEITACMPNLSAEIYFTRRWSAELSALYAKWDYFSGDKLWAVTAYTIEPRYWFSHSGVFRGFYAGPYGQWGSFDNQPDRIQGSDNRTGTFWTAGVSFGYMQPLSKHWGFEFGISGGYCFRDYDYYDIEKPFYYYSHSAKDGKFQATVRIKLLYRLVNDKHE